MEYLIDSSLMIVLIIYFLILFFLKKDQIENFVKLYLLYGFVFVFPLVAIFIPVFEIGPLTLDAYRIFLLPSLAFLVLLYVKNSFKIKIPKFCVYLFIFSVYLILNSSLRGYFRDEEIINFLLPIVFIMVMENVKYDEKDLQVFHKNIFMLAVIVFVVSLIQIVINPNFYVGNWRVEQEHRWLAFGSTYRSESIFAGINAYEGAIAVSCLFLIFLFLNFKTYNFKYLVIAGLVAFSAFLTFTRTVWAMVVMTSLLFVYYKYKKQRLVAFLVLVFVVLTLFSTFFPIFQESQLYKVRVASDSYMGRVVSLRVFFKHFWGKKMTFGHGDWSLPTGEFLPFRRSTVHNGFLDILFRAGFLGLFLYFLFLYQYYKRGKRIFDLSGNPTFLVFLILFVFLNLTGIFMNIDYYGYLLIFFYMSLFYQIYAPKKMRIQEE